METRFYVCGIGYDKNYCVIDYEKDFGDFDTYEEAYNLYKKLQDRNEKSFFKDAPKVYQLLIQLEECEEDDNVTECIDVTDEFWIVNPNYNK